MVKVMIPLTFNTWEDGVRWLLDNPNKRLYPGSGVNTHYWVADDYGSVLVVFTELSTNKPLSLLRFLQMGTFYVDQDCKDCKDCIPPYQEELHGALDSGSSVLCWVDQGPYDPCVKLNSENYWVRLISSYDSEDGLQYSDGIEYDWQTAIPLTQKEVDKFIAGNIQ